MFRSSLALCAIALMAVPAAASTYSATLAVPVSSRIIARDIAPGRSNPVSGIRKPLPVVAGLRPVFGDRETGQLAAIRPQTAHVPDHRDGEHGLRAAVSRIGNERVAALAGSGTGIADAFEIPVIAAIVRVGLPVVPAGVVAAVAVHGDVQVEENRGAGVGHPVDIRVDGVAIGVGVDGNRYGRILPEEQTRQQEDSPSAGEARIGGNCM